MREELVTRVGIDGGRGLAEGAADARVCHTLELLDDFGDQLTCDGKVSTKGTFYK